MVFDYTALICIINSIIISELILLCTSGAIHMRSPDLHLTVEDLYSNSTAGYEVRKNLFKGKRIHETIKHFLPIFDSRGLLDPLH